eukprot:CAMPEP_0174892456 /NCGR_PEP_ID=MMETSP0167-20121228/7407_1 /TAXON_ID=38298 /ORGANISM="Rhodella maculata, Strain CCMP736" /LENGTH=403 /DNA_ID=CAMNT_0016130957 /DNA_START=322 /DNA_END=1533 /DNA_ORIENTATION=+
MIKTLVPEGHLFVLTDGLSKPSSTIRQLHSRISVSRDPQDPLPLLFTPSDKSITRGLNAAGDDLADAIVSYLEMMPRTQARPAEISFCGIGLGGLVVRYAAGILLSGGPQGPTIARMKPRNLVTVFTPNVGIPLEAPANSTGSRTWWGLRDGYRGWSMRRNGMGPVCRQLGLRDQNSEMELKDEMHAVEDEDYEGPFTDDNTVPLLMELCDDNTAPFLSALAAFDKRVLYADVSGRGWVPATSAMLSADRRELEPRTEHRPVSEGSSTPSHARQRARRSQAPAGSKPLRESIHLPESATLLDRIHDPTGWRLWFQATLASTRAEGMGAGDDDEMWWTEDPKACAELAASRMRLVGDWELVAVDRDSTKMATDQVWETPVGLRVVGHIAALLVGEEKGLFRPVF